MFDAFDRDEAVRENVDACVCGPCCVCARVDDVHVYVCRLRMRKK